METVRQPGCRVDVEVPADRICAVSFQRVEGIHGIPLTLAHLLAILILHVAQNDYVLVRCLVEQERRLCKQGMEPSTGLIHCLGDELCRELLLEELLILKRIMMLRKRHCAGVKPAVQNLRHALHLAAAVRTL